MATIFAVVRLVLHFLPGMEHWDAWLAEDVFRATTASADEKEESCSSSTVSEESRAKKEKKQKPKKKLKMKKKKIVSPEKGRKKLEQDEYCRQSSPSTSSAICTPTRDSPKMTTILTERSKGGQRIFIRQLLDEKNPLEELLKIDMPQELKDELLDWEKKFPNLTVRGKAIGKSPELVEREKLRLLIARKLVENHLWPEMQSILSTKGGKKQPKGKSSHLLMPEMGDKDKEKALPKMAKKKMKAVKLPAI